MPKFSCYYVHRQYFGAGAASFWGSRNGNRRIRHSIRNMGMQLSLLSLFISKSTDCCQSRYNYKRKKNNIERKKGSYNGKME
jgi:DNA polymerase/3'-5' exonuclease PolX